MATEAQKTFFRHVWHCSARIYYLAKSPEEYKALGGVLDPQEDPMVRSLPCVAAKIDTETGVADLTLLVDLKGRRGQTLHGVPFKNPSGRWPYPQEPGGTWHGLTTE